AGGDPGDRMESDDPQWWWLRCAGQPFAGHGQLSVPGQRRADRPASTAGAGLSSWPSDRPVSEPWVDWCTLLTADACVPIADNRRMPASAVSHSFRLVTGSPGYAGRPGAAAARR